MAEFKLGRIRFVYQGAWAATTSYVVDDVISIGGKTYICVLNHTASSLFATDSVAIPAKWSIVADGLQWRNNWTATTYYNKGDLVKFGGLVYQCNTAHTSATYVTPTYLGLENDQSKWDIFATSFNWTGAWTTGTRYRVNDFVSYGGYTYVCKTKHISDATLLENDASNWNIFNAGITYLGAWSGSSIRYKLNDVVKYGADLWICTTYHTSSSTFDNTNWSVFVNGFQFESSWNSGASYQIGDTVTYGGYSYIAKTNNNNSQPSNNPADWDVYTTGFSFKGDWVASTSYKNGEIVRLDSYTYLCTTDTTALSQTATTTTVSTDSTNPNTILVTSTAGFEANMAVKFSGTPFGGITANQTYYIVSGFSATRFKVSLLPSGAVVALTTASGAMTASVVAQPPLATHWSRLNSGLQWTNNAQTYTGTAGANISTTGTVAIATGLGSSQIVLTGNPGVYVGILVTGTNIQAGTTISAIAGNIITLSLTTSGAIAANATLTFGSNLGSSATFNIVRSGTVYTVALNAAGTNYAVGHQIKVLGTAIGGQTPVNDLIITVASITGSAIATVTFTGISSTWSASISYVLGDVAFFGANSYICVQAHTSVTGNRPDNDTLGAYWNILSAGAEVATLTTSGDTFYYGPNGPTRLPIGSDGQILRSTNGYPAWSNFGVINNVVYVGPTGVDSAYPDYGSTIDRPWKTIRFASRQIENGYLNPQVQMLLAKNKQFLMKEISNYVTYTYKAAVTGTSGGAFLTASTSGLIPNQPIVFSNLTGSLTVASVAVDTSTVYYVKAIVTDTSFTVSTTISAAGVAGTAATAAGSGTGTASLSYNYAKCERDVGLLIDALIFDIGHGGTQKSTQAAQSYFGSNGSFITTAFGYEATQSAASYNYLKNTLLLAVASNVAPLTNYQTLNSVAIPAIQVIDTTLTAEATTITTIQSLLNIVTAALTAGTSTAIPTVVNPQTTISVKTGTYNEILPIVIPSNTAIIGDELRSTVIQPATANTLLVNDKAKTISALNRIKSVIPSIVSNTLVVTTTGNTQTQQYLFNANLNTQTASIASNVSVMKSILSTGLSAVPTYVYPDPSGYGAGFSNARRLILSNKQFFKDEVTAYMNVNYTSLWSSLGAAGQALCTRDIGYIIDAVVYDLTYGETSGCNLATVIAARSYYSNGTFVEASGEKTAALAVQTRLQSVISDVALANGVTRSTGNVTSQDRSGTAGSAPAATFAVARITEVYNTINTGTTPTTIAPSTAWVAAAKTTANASIQSAKASLQSNLITWITSTYPGFYFNQATCSRDAGYIIDALCYDMMFGSNFLSSWNAMSYYRAITSTQLVISSQLNQTLGTISYLGAAAQEITSGVTNTVGSLAAVASVVSNATAIYDVVSSGFASVPTFVLPQPTGYNASYLVGYGDGLSQIVQNYAFIKADILQYIANNYASVYSAMSPATCARDIGFILDALQFDMTYGGNTQTLVAGSTYYSNYLLTIATTEKAATIAAYTQLKTLISQVVLKTGVVAQSGNTIPWITSGTAGSAGAATFAQARIQDIIDWINNAISPVVVAPSITWTSANLQLAYSAVQARRTEIQNDTVVWVKKFFQAMSFNQTTCSRDAGLIVDALAYDMVFGSNVSSIVAGRAYLRATSSAQVVYNSQRPAELGAINFIKYKVKAIASSGALAAIHTTIDDITGFISGGTTPRLSWSNPALPNASYATVSGTNITGTGTSSVFTITRLSNGYSIIITNGGSGYSAGNTIKIVGTAIGGTSPTNDIVLTVASVSTGVITNVTYSDIPSGLVLLQDNKAFIQADIAAYLNTNYNSVWVGLGSAGQAKCTRDVSYLVDALTYDLKYGGNSASKQAGLAYYSNAVLQIAAGEQTATVAAYGRLSTIAQQIVTNTAVTVSTGNSQSQIRANGAQAVGTSLMSTSLGALATAITNIITNGPTAGVPTITITAIATLNTLTAAGHGMSNGDLVTPQATVGGLTSGTTYYVVGASTNTFQLAATFGGTVLASFTNGSSYSIVAEVTNMPNTAWVDSALVTQYTALSAAKATIQSAIVAYLTTTYPTLVYTQATCTRDVGYIVDAVGYDLMLNSNFKTTRSGQAYFRYIASDLIVLNTERSQTIAAYNYLKLQIAATLSTNTTAVTRSNAGMDGIISIVSNGDGVTPEFNGTITYNNTLGTIQGAELLRANKNFLAYEGTAWISANFGGTVITTAASGNVITTSAAHNLSVGDPVTFSAVTVATAATATAVTGNLITVASTVGMAVNMPITFTGTNANGITGATQYYIKSIPTPGVNGTITISATQSGGVAGTVLTILATGAVSFTVQAGGLFGNLISTNVLSGLAQTYYVLTALSTTTFTITATQNSSTPVTLQNAGGVATATYGFNAALCRRDMNEWLDAIIYDMQYPGNYKSLRAAQIYNNAITGSITQDMFRVRNGSGLRNCTLNGLTGTLTNPNSYGTKRPTAGAYVALDPGFGPNDSNVWVTSRSHYSQNVTMFGSGCTGAKIDSALHTGGNKSMVKNDFTTIISDGIGVWVTGSGALTELVSVFNYYGYSGYLAELGGRIRATNGNSSYGTYGVIAEGVDSFETPLYGTLNNRLNPAQVSLALTDSANQLLRLEYSNAGSAYTNYSPSISGSGYNATAIGDEFRDSAIFETRLTDLNDGNGYGGTGYLTAANTAQNGGAGYVTIAAADTQLSTAYAGMRIFMTAGTGVGQYAQILTYNNGSKVAQIIKESYTSITVTATSTTNNLLTVASTASLYTGMPIYLSGTMTGTGGDSGLLANTVYYVNSANFSATQFQVSLTAGGAGAAVTISNNVTALTISVSAAGWDYVVPGAAIVNALDLTSTYIIEPRTSYSAPGYTAAARTLPATTTWGNVTYGAGKFLTVSSNGTATAYSNDGKTWSAGGNTPTSSTWVDLVYGGGQGAVATAVIGGQGGQSAVLTAVLGTAGGSILADQIASVTIVSGGFGYVTAPTILFTPTSGGSGATATCTVLNGSITSVSIVIPGSGYSAAPTVLAATDRVTSFPVTTWGKNYASAPTVTVDDPFTGSAWSSGGSATLNTKYYYVNSNVKNWYTCTSAGTFTTTGPTHTTGTTTNGTASLLYIGTTAIGTASLTNGGVSTIAVTNAGAGYTTTPVVSIVDPVAKFVIIPTTGNASSLYNTVSTIGSTWQTSATVIPTGTYASIAFGNGYYVALGGASSTTRSTDGSTWASAGTIATLGAGSWSSIAYGNNTFVAISTGSSLATSYSTTSASSWAVGGNLPAGFTTGTSIAYGNGRFVALASSGAVAYSLTAGVTWIVAPTATGATTSILSSSYTWTKVAYGQGQFVAIASGTAVCATSPDGVNWTVRAMPSSSNWKGIAFGNPTQATIGSTPIFAAVSNTSGIIAASIKTGARAMSRVTVKTNVISEVRMNEPGSGYPKGIVSATTTSTNLITADTTDNLIDSQPVEFTGLTTAGLTANVTYYVIGSTITSTQFKVSLTAGSATPVTLNTQSLTGTYRAGPVLTQTDPNKIKTAAMRVRQGDGALGQPTFTNRGTANTTATASITGDGYGDLYQASNFINVSGIYSQPSAGANVEFASLPGTYFKLVAVTPGTPPGSAGNYNYTFQVNPALTVYQAPANGDLITTRIKYSQVRLTGHDFLYIGTGGFAATNYPNVDTSKAITANQSNSSNGGRVFFTSTDQDGNFNVGNLFGVQQSTGTATLNASAFNLSGLQSLQLGTVSVGAGSATITSFSTDPYFTANSDNILPTQRAIKSYITAQIGGGQSSLNVNTLTSGVIYVANNSISTTTGVQINVTAKMNFTGGIDGAPVALAFFMQR